MKLISYKRETFLNPKDKEELARKVSSYGMVEITKVIEKKGHFCIILQSLKYVYITKKGIQVCI